MKDYTQDAFDGMWADMKAPKRIILPKVKYQSNLNKEKMRLAQLKAQIKTKKIQAQINKMNAEQNARRVAAIKAGGARLIEYSKKYLPKKDISIPMRSDYKEQIYIRGKKV